VAASIKLLIRWSAMPARISHSHNSITVHPSFRSSRIVVRSRLRFDLIFGSQYPSLDLGRDPSEQVCPCQKHPWTSTIFRCLGSTISGLPGKVLTCTRKRYPSACSKDRIAISGLVFFDLIRDISAERSEGVSVSVNGQFLLGMLLSCRCEVLWIRRSLPTTGKLSLRR